MHSFRLWNLNLLPMKPEKVITLTKTKQTKIDSLLYQIKNSISPHFSPPLLLYSISNLEVLWSGTDPKAEWGLQLLNAKAQSSPKPHFFLFHELCHTDKYLIRKLKAVTWNSQNKPKSMRLQYALHRTNI